MKAFGWDPSTIAQLPAIGGGGRFPVRFVPDGNGGCTACPPTSAQKQFVNKVDDPADRIVLKSTDCKNGEYNGKCITDAQIDEDSSCTVLMQGQDCAATCSVLSNYGHCVKMCGPATCTEYLNETTSRDLASESAKFVADNGGDWTALCTLASVVSGGTTTARGMKLEGPPKIRNGMVGIAITAVNGICAAAGYSQQSGINQAMQSITKNGGCLKKSTRFGFSTWGVDNSGFCTKE